MKKRAPLCRQYRYFRWGNGRIDLRAIPDYGMSALRFYTATYRIANEMFNGGGYGAALNSVCTAQYGGVIFQHRDLEENLKRARAVTKRWREEQRELY